MHGILFFCLAAACIFAASTLLHWQEAKKSGQLKWKKRAGQLALMSTLSALSAVFIAYS